MKIKALVNVNYIKADSLGEVDCVWHDTVYLKIYGTENLMKVTINQFNTFFEKLQNN